MTRLTVTLPHAVYPVFVENGVFDRIGALAAELLGRTGRAMIVTDTRVDRILGVRLSRTLGRAGWDVTTVTIPPGESRKTIKNLLLLYRNFLRHQLERSSPVFALGGGVIGDLAGFAAATYMRGVPLFQVPTTLLAQVDASIGGKTGLNLPDGKNLIGSFTHPKAVFTDPSVLKTLPPREWANGLAEAVKCGVILDAPLFEKLDRNVSRIMRRDPETIGPVIRTCVSLKIKIVQKDERESGVRALLNYGHTLGHAIEAVHAFRGRTHGEAVALGMGGEAWLASKLGMIDREVLNRQTRLLHAFSLPVCDSKLSASRVLKFMQADKKNHKGKYRFSLPERLGAGRFGIEAPDALVRQAIHFIRREKDDLIQ